MNHNDHCFGSETVIRWNHPIFGSIYPPLLIYIAKAGSILLDFDMQLFNMACATIQDTLKHYQVPSEKLWMEITEQNILYNSQNILDRLSRIKEMGQSLLIDDFG